MEKRHVRSEEKKEEKKIRIRTKEKNNTSFA